MTPEQLAALSACFRCVADRQAAILYLLATIAGVTVDQIITGSACYRCVVDFQSAELFLLNTIASAPAPVSDAVTCGVGAPVTAPSSGCGVYYDTSNDAVYIYRGGAWVLKV
jgi:hypothetical protein